jgi:hypothetical protein
MSGALSVWIPVLDLSALDLFFLLVPGWYMKFLIWSHGYFLAAKFISIKRAEHVIRYWGAALFSQFCLSCLLN